MHAKDALPIVVLAAALPAVLARPALGAPLPGSERALRALILEFVQDGMRADPKHLDAELSAACKNGYQPACKPDDWRPDGAPDLIALHGVFGRSCAPDDPVACVVSSWPALQLEPEELQAMGLERLDGIRALEQACDTGLTRACSDLGWMLRGWEGVPLNLPRATALLEGACQRGEGNACAGRGIIELYDVDPANEIDALPFLERGCELGDALSCDEAGWFLGLDDHDPIGTQEIRQDLKRSVAFFEQACELGFTQGCNHLAVKLDAGKGSREQQARARRLFWRACEGGEPWGCHNLAESLRYGDGGRKDLAEAARLHERACADGIGDSCNVRGRMADRGEGVPEDPRDETPWYERACELGVAVGCYNAAIQYDLGDGAPQDDDKAAAHYERGCELGEESSCNSRAIMADQGRGPPLDAPTMLEYFERGCELGEAIACVNAGERLRQGLDVPVGLDRAQELLLRGCELGEGKGCGLAAIRYIPGQTENPDWDRVLALIEQGCDLGDADSCATRASLAWSGLVGPPDPDAADRWYRLATAALENNDPFGDRPMVLEHHVEFLRQFGREEQALVVLDQLETIHRLAEDDARLASALAVRGMTLYDLSRMQEALDTVDEAVRVSERLPQGHAGRFEPLSTRGQILGALDRYEEAKMSLRAALQLPEPPSPLPGHDHAMARNSLALVLSAKGRFDEAEALMTSAIETLRGLGPGVHPSLVDLLAHQAHIHWNRGHYDHALAVNQEARDLAAQTAVSPTRLVLLTVDRGVLLIGSGRFAEAVETLTEGLEQAQRTLGDEHHHTATAHRNLAQAFNRQGDLTRAREHELRALAIREAVLGPNHPDTITSLTSIASLECHAGRYRDAEGWVERSLSGLDGMEASQGQHAPLRATVLANAGVVASSNGKAARAEELKREAYELLHATLGADHPDTLRALNNLAMGLLDAARYEEAAEMMEAVVRGATEHLGSEHPQTLRYRTHKATLKQSLAYHAVAEAELRAVLEIQLRTTPNAHAVIVETQSVLGDNLRMQGGYADAQTVWEEALERASKSELRGSALHVRTLNNVGLILHERGDLGRAQQRYQEAIALAETVFGPEHPDVAVTLSNFAALLGTMGAEDQGMALAERALKIYRDAFGDHHPRVAEALSRVATFHYNKGDFLEAERLREEALAIRVETQGPEHPETLNVRAILASVQAELGKRKQAEQERRAVLKSRLELLGEQHPSTADSQRALANQLLDNQDVEDDSEAWALLDRAQRTYASVYGEDSLEFASLLGIRSLAHWARDQYEEALALGQTATRIRKRILGGDHPNTRLSVQNLALFHHALGNTKRARAMLDTALEGFAPGLDRADLNLSLMLANRAMYSWALGNLDAAIADALESARIDEESTARVLVARSAAEQRHWLDGLHHWTEAWVSMSLGSAPESRPAAELALTIVLQRKGRQLAAERAQRIRLRERMGPEGLALLEELEQAVASLDIVERQASRELDRDGWRTRRETLQAKVDSLETELGRTSAAYAEHHGTPSIESVAAELPDGSVLLEYVHYRRFDPAPGTQGGGKGEARYGAFVIDREGLQGWRDLGPAGDVEAEVRALRKAIQTRAAIDEPARALHARLLGPFTEALDGTQHLLVAPDGQLNLVPFAALQDPRGGALLEQRAVTLLDSGRDLLGSPPSETLPTEAVVVANVDFDNRQRPPSASDSTGQGSFPVDQSMPGQRHAAYAPLPGTTAEGQAVSNLLANARLLEGSAATETTLRSLRGPSVLHVASHGFFLGAPPSEDSTTRSTMIGQLHEPDIPVTTPSDRPMLRSGLVLAGANIPPEAGDNGLLTAAEVANMDLRGTRLAVLSACETGVGEVRNGDGVHGLRRALVIAGAETQVLSLWKVDDDATAALMAAFYERLSTGQGRAEALREAQLSMAREAGERDWTHPYYWASFALSGAWEGSIGTSEQ